LRARLSSRGVSALAAAAALTIVAAASGDLVIACAAALIYAAVALDAIHAALRRAREACVAQASEGRARLWVGQRKVLRVLVRCSDLESVELSHPSMSIRRAREAGRDEVELEVVAEPRYAEVIKGVELRLLQRSRLGMIYIERILRIELSLEVLPRAWLLALLALAILGGRAGRAAAGASVEGLRPFARSCAGAYYESREYQPGDPANRIDWKASSRLLKLIVREYVEESLGGALVILDDRCLGPLTCDALASTLLSVAIASFEASAPMSLYLESSGQHLVLDPSRALAFAVRKALEMTRVAEVDPYEILEPLSPAELRRLLRIDASPATRIDIYRLAEMVSSASRAIIIATLVTNTSTEIEIASLMKMRGASIEVYTPRKPWIDLGDLERAYVAYRTHRIAVGKLRRLGCVVREVEPSGPLVASRD